MQNVTRIVAVAGIMLACVSGAQAMTMDFVPVGNPGNSGEQSRLDQGDTTYYGGVAFKYNIGKYEVTSGQYRAFLNAVAKTDTHGLYNTSMWAETDGCKIERIGSSGNYSYSVAADWADRPVNYVSFWDACRFANWMHNDQGSGDTETGAYTLTADGIVNNTVTRNPGAKVWVPSENEWYKAAYHKNDGVTGNYFEHPTSSDSTPSNELSDPDPGNNANHQKGGAFTIGSPYWRTEVGEFENSESPYNTFDQAGNVAEWNEAIFGPARGIRGGAFNYDSTPIRASVRVNYYATDELAHIGFRLAAPEPAMIAMLALGGLAVLRRRR